MTYIFHPGHNSDGKHQLTVLVLQGEMNYDGDITADPDKILCWGFTAQSTQWGHVERDQFT